MGQRHNLTGYETKENTIIRTDITLQEDTKMSHLNTRILIVDDQDDIHVDFQEILDKDNKKATSDDLADAFLTENSETNTTYMPSFELTHASSGDEACQLVRTAKEENRPFAAAYVDIRMPPGMDGIETIRRIREFEKNLEIVIMTAYTDKPVHEIVTSMGSLHKLLYIRKPVMTAEIQLITFSLVEKWNVEQETVKHQRELAMSYQRLEAVFDAMGDAVSVLNHQGKLLFANQQYCQLFDISQRELSGISPDELNARVNARLRKLKLSKTEHPVPHKSTTNVLEDIGNLSCSDQRLFYSFVTSLSGGVDGVADKVVSYRVMS